jgi:hypothetical protein
MVLGLGSVVYSRVEATNQSSRGSGRVAVACVVHRMSLCMCDFVGPRGVWRSTQCSVRVVRVKERPPVVRDRKFRRGE